MSGVIHQLSVFGNLIKFSHSVFALPFALISVILASWELHDLSTLPIKIFWIIVAMVSARTAAMAFNRLVDAPIDAANPRTASREIPAGKITKPVVAFFIILSTIIFVFAAGQLNFLCLVLSPVALAVIFTYSLTKRFTWLAHLVLGLGIGLSPVGAWLAITGEFSIISILLGMAVTVWIAGFDIIYACQDADFDKKAGLFSIPSKFGTKTALSLARMLHVFMVFILLLTGVLSPSGYFYYLGVAVLGILLIFEHRLVNPDDLTKIQIAFFNVNSAIAMVFFAFVLVDRLVS